MGDRLVSINGEKPRDLIDYRFLIADEFLELVVLDRDDRLHEIEIEKDYDEDLGLEFEVALFDGLIQCSNRCPFCFIDQQPPGKRESLYFKDDDYRLSFLYGSYLTLTNLSQREWDRIERLRLSPLYVSVHATNPEVRSRLLKNPRAGQILNQLAWFQARQLQIHAQVVVCPDLNDGDILRETLEDLVQFYPGEIPTVTSVAIVPVGLTRFRPDQDELRPVTPADAVAVIERVQALQGKFLERFGTRFAWLADEWFLIGGEELPAQEEYEDLAVLNKKDIQPGAEVVRAGETLVRNGNRRGSSGGGAGGGSRGIGPGAGAVVEDEFQLRSGGGDRVDPKQLFPGHGAATWADPRHGGGGPVGVAGGEVAPEEVGVGPRGMEKNGFSFPRRGDVVGSGEGVCGGEVGEGVRGGPVGGGEGAADEFVGEGFPVRQGDLAAPDVAGGPRQFDRLEGIVASQGGVGAEDADLVAVADVVGVGEEDGLGDAPSPEREGQKDQNRGDPKPDSHGY